MTTTGPEKYRIIEGEEYLNPQEACAYLGGITTQTLRTRTKAVGVKPFKQQIGPNKVYYKKKELDDMRRMRPVKEK